MVAERTVVEVAMPRLSDQLEEATIVRWCVAGGETVARGEELVEVETDKATMPHEAEADGVVELLAPEGATVALGAVERRVVPSGAGDGTTISACASATLTADHRILYGADAARFLAAIRDHLQAPLGLLL